MLEGAQVLPVLRQRRKRDRATLRGHQVDVWHAMNAGYAWLALDLPQPVVVSVHGNDFLRPYVLAARPELFNHYRLGALQRACAPLEAHLGEILTMRLMRRALPRARHIIANSRYTEQVLLKQFPACHGTTSTAWVGVGEQFFDIQPIPSEHGVARLITICRLSEPRKNVALVLHALAALRDRYHYTYTVVGDGSEKPALEQLAQELGIAERVSFTGFVDNETLQHHLAASDLFILTASINPHSHEGFGIVYLEANASGVPVLAARLAGAAEAVAENSSGMFVEAPSVPAIRDALERFLSGAIRFDPEVCRNFARRFGWAKVVAHAEKYYDGASPTGQQ